MVPDYCTQRCKMAICVFNEASAAIDCAVANQKGSMKELTATLTEAKDAVSSACVSLQSQVAQATEANMILSGGGA